MTPAFAAGTLAAMRILAPLCAIVLLLAAGCPPPERGAGGPASPAAPEPPARPAAPPRPPETQSAVPLPSSMASGNGGVMATVNGEPIYMKQLTEQLVRAHGLLVAEMLVADKLVAQEAARREITVTGEEIAQERSRQLRAVLGDELTGQQRDRVLEELLRRRGLTREVWERTMWRRAVLRKMALPRVSVTEPMIRAQFLAQYGQKVQVRHMQLPSVFEAQKILKLIQEGRDFAELAKRYSTNATTAAQGGLLPPFTRDDPRVDKAVRDAAFALSKPGQVSEVVQAGRNFHVLKLVRRIVPPDADYESVRDTIREGLRDRLVERVQQEILHQLRQSAAVEYVDPLLKQARDEATRPRP